MTGSFNKERKMDKEGGGFMKHHMIYIFIDLESMHHLKSICVKVLLLRILVVHIMTYQVK